MDDDEVAAAVSNTHMVVVFLAVSLSVMLYDTALTLDRELVYIWRNRWTSMTYLYFITRYSTIFGLVLELALKLGHWKSLAVPVRGSPIRPSSM
ncbi:hypothetical protein K474DRAFT_269465 [Panus rudis PR-1116 ss-1]|nr:hypothetical protein K474DRAFT_269465 [Panus rudis PR-1116 ss-1]